MSPVPAQLDSGAEIFMTILFCTWVKEEEGEEGCTSRQIYSVKDKRGFCVIC